MLITKYFELSHDLTGNLILKFPVNEHVKEQMDKVKNGKMATISNIGGKYMMRVDDGDCYEGMSLT